MSQWHACVHVHALRSTPPERLQALQVWEQYDKCAVLRSLTHLEIKQPECLDDPQVVMYDASGVRLHAGKQASVLNMIITELPPDHPVSDTRPLRDTLGHTPLQVGIVNLPETLIPVAKSAATSERLRPVP